MSKLSLAPHGPPTSADSGPDRASAGQLCVSGGLRFDHLSVCQKIEWWSLGWVREGWSIKRSLLGCSSDDGHCIVSERMKVVNFQRYLVEFLCDDGHWVGSEIVKVVNFQRFLVGFSCDDGLGCVLKSCWSLGRTAELVLVSVYWGSLGLSDCILYKYVLYYSLLLYTNPPGNLGELPSCGATVTAMLHRIESHWK